MASGNFERCLAITLKWEGGYSNHPDDPGGPTMNGIIQREYDAWRKKNGKRNRPVRQIGEEELRAIYRGEYWNAMGCNQLAAGMDLCVFDAAVNSGVARAKAWLEAAQDIEAFCDARLAFLQRLGRLWRVFGTGWRRRVAGIRKEAHLMAEHSVITAPSGLRQSIGFPKTTSTETHPMASTAPASTGTGTSIFTDIVDAAKTSFTTIWTAIAGMFGSASAGTVLVTLLTHINPSLTTLIVAVLGIAGTILGAIASAYHLITHVNATNSATIALAEKWLNAAEGWFGQQPINFRAENGGAPAPASASPAPGAAPAPAGA